MPSAVHNPAATRVLLCLALSAAGLDVVADEDVGWTTETSLKQFNQSVKPLLGKYCFDCHGPNEQESDFRIDVLDQDMVKGQHGGKWREVLDALNRGDMPPDEAAQPSERERDVIIDWMTNALNNAAKRRRSTGGHVVLRRLTRREYNNTMRDMLGLEMDFAKDLPPDLKSINGYKNNGQFLGMSELQLQEYYKAAKRGLASGIVRGEQPEPIIQKVTECAKGVRFDSLALAPFSKELGGTVVGFSQPNSKGKKKGATRKNVMVLLVRDKLPTIGAFRVKIRAAATGGDESMSPPRMRVAVGHKTGVGIEPQRQMGLVDVTAPLDQPQVFEFTGRFEEYPLHTGPTLKKFPGLRVLITDENARVPGSGPKRTGKTAEQKPAEEHPQLVVLSVEFESPIEAAWPPTHHKLLLPTRNADEGEDSYLRRTFRGFISRAFRRPAEDSEVEWAMRYYSKTRPSKVSFEDAVTEVFALVLVSPRFLYLPESQADKKNTLLTDHELAARLSYFLWGTTPDSELRQLAVDGSLQTDARLRKQVKLMLSDARSWRFVEHFAGQWLDLDGVDAVAVNPEFFPNFDNSLKQDMKQESLHFFAEVLRSNLSCLNFIASDFVMVNDRLAEFYGIDNPRSGHFRKVQLPADSVRRGGVLTQASFLLSTSTGDESHPIYRARWFLDRIMGAPPGEPPADVPELDMEKKEVKRLSLKEQLELHRAKSACNRCHRRLDPWGIPFESFNGIGQHIGSLTSESRARGKQPKSVVQDDTTLPDGTNIKGSRELTHYLMKARQEQFAEAFCRHLLTYALGRSLEWTDQPLIDRLFANFRANGYKMSGLISDIVLSDAFRSK